mmetsp:Transcript_6216/g.9697  ORF Transcript_6216/g.9697 Transcript_6216/m.9697 type:complete len:86 (-) Transcript_6216:793-1050(-)
MQPRLTSTIVHILLLIMRMPHHLNHTTARTPTHATTVTQTSTIRTTIRRDGILLPHVKACLGQGNECKKSCEAIENNEGIALGDS